MQDVVIGGEHGRMNVGNGGEGWRKGDSSIGGTSWGAPGRGEGVVALAVISRGRRGIAHRVSGVKRARLRRCWSVGWSW